MSNVRTISKAKVLSEYGILNAEGKVSLEVISASGKPWVNPRLKAASKTYKHSYLVNFKAIEARKALAVMEAFGDNDEMPLEDFNFNIVKEIIVHEGSPEPTLPISGERVDCNLAYAIDKNEGGYAKDQNGDNILEIRSMVVKQASTVASFGSFANKVKETTAATAPARQSVGADDDADY